MLVDFDVRVFCFFITGGIVGLWIGIWPATLKQGTQTKLLEGQGPAEFTFNPNETHLISKSSSYESDMVCMLEQGWN